MKRRNKKNATTTKQTLETKDLEQVSGGFGSWFYYPTSTTAAYDDRDYGGRNG